MHLIARGWKEWRRTKLEGKVHKGMLFLWRGKRRILRSRINGNDGEEESCLSYEYVNACFVATSETTVRTL
jgi:hypothetical protein